MPLDIVTIPCLSDNYAYLVNGPDGTLLIDAPEAAPIAAELDSRVWNLSAILLTHHHHDHVGGVEELRAQCGCKVMGPAAEQEKLPPLDRALAEGDGGGSGDGAWTVLSVPGHTLGHIAFHFPAARAVFSADSLMALGCGRVFEGTPAMMWDTMRTFLALPDDTRVYSGHEYTAANARFALTVEPDNGALQERARRIEAGRARGEPTVPSTIAEEKATNPFMRAHLQTLKARLDMASTPDADVFAEIRKRKDAF